jgi:hypothetical protein
MTWFHSVSVYICEWPIWPCTAHSGPCIANSIYPPSLGLEEYTEIIPLSWYQLGFLSSSFSSTSSCRRLPAMDGRPPPLPLSCIPLLAPAMDADALAPALVAQHAQLHDFAPLLPSSSDPAAADGALADSTTAGLSSTLLNAGPASADAAPDALDPDATVAALRAVLLGAGVRAPALEHLTTLLAAGTSPPRRPRPLPPRAHPRWRWPYRSSPVQGGTAAVASPALAAGAASASGLAAGGPPAPSWMA